MPRGYIYRIHHKDSVTGEDQYPNKCYIGQTRQTVEKRFRQHLRDARELDLQADRERHGKTAKLHEFILICRPKNIAVEQIYFAEAPTQLELQQILNTKERSYIEKYDSLKSLNKVLPPKDVTTMQAQGVFISEIAEDFGVPYTTLLNRMKKDPAADVEEIAKELSQRIEERFIYARQTFKALSDVSKSERFNPHGVSTKTIQSRVRKMREGDELRETMDRESGVLFIELTDKVFEPTRKKKSISITTPDGKTLSGSIKELHDILLPLYPDLVPEGYTTVQGRLSKPHWNAQRAFGFDYPPDLQEIKSLIEQGGYKWAEGKKPDFRSHQGTKPLVLEETKEVFVSQKAFAEVFKIAEDQLSDLIARGMSADQILEKLGLTA